MGITLRGLTWDHPRGYAPLVAGVPEYKVQRPEIDIQWDRRSLREFGEAPIEQYLNRYDLLVVDHPFVGFAAAHRALVDLAPSLQRGRKRHFAEDSVGPSWESYWYGGGLRHSPSTPRRKSPPIDPIFCLPSLCLAPWTVSWN